MAANAFYNGELENEIRLLINDNHDLNLKDFTLRRDADRENIMEQVESIRSQTIYPHHQCSKDCRDRGEVKMVALGNQ